MRKVFKLQDLECANCAAKMEERIVKLEGVKSARVNFLTQKFTLDADDASFERIVDEAQKIMTSVERDCTIIR